MSGKRQRILVSTLYPLGGNYGGVLQAYALQRVIRGLGFEVFTINSRRDYELIRSALHTARALAQKCVSRGPVHFPLDRASVGVVQKNIERFISENLSTVDLFGMSKSEMKRFLASLHGIVVGSDQVWRGGYADVLTQLLSYVDSSDQKKISYAASFGADYPIRFSRRVRRKSREYAQMFDFMSVRESSGVDLCRRLWGMKAEQHVDPTLLLNSEDYLSLIGDSVRPLPPTGGLLVYALDLSPALENYAERLGAELGIDVKTLHTPKPASSRDVQSHPEAYQMPSVEFWLQSFANAGFVLTDSFHGVVFSIVFRKPFLALGNERRGMARFESLLSLLGLESRLVALHERPLMPLDPPDWDVVERRIAAERERSLSYLRSTLE